MQDLDNDGRTDLVTTVLFRNDVDQLQPLVLKNLGTRRGPIQFASVPNDRLVTYYAPGPIADFDRDGRVDMFLPSWFESVPSRLYRNVSPGGHWLTIRVTAANAKQNRMGIGATIRAYAAGHCGDPRQLLAQADVVVGTGYTSGEEALAHLGLGDVTECDVRLTWGELQNDWKSLAVDRLLELSVRP